MLSISLPQTAEQMVAGILAAAQHDRQMIASGACCRKSFRWSLSRIIYEAVIEADFGCGPVARNPYHETVFCDGGNVVYTRKFAEKTANVGKRHPLFNPIKIGFGDAKARRYHRNHCKDEEETRSK
jgi:hypothetical protein